jgi:thiol-disulfide isomerase/thioredoxin
MCILYSPWCQHCKQWIHFFQQIAENVYHRIHFCAINSEDIYHKNDHITAELNIKQYPTLLWFTPNSTLSKEYKNPNMFTFQRWKQTFTEEDLQLWIYSFL